jgi:hypothetical protein
MAKTRRARKARKPTRKSVRKNKVYRGGNPLEVAYETNYREWLAEKTNKTKFDAVYDSLKRLIANMQTTQPINSEKLEKLKNSEEYLDGLAKDWPSDVKFFEESEQATLKMPIAMYKP